MSSFYGAEIVFDSIPSSYYGLRVGNFESGISDGNAGSESTLYQKFVYRKSKPYYYGRTQNISLEMDITLFAEDPIDATLRSITESWLLGRMGYLPLQIIQDDLKNVTFYVMFNKASNKYIGNIDRSISIHGVCNAPWGFESPKVLTKTWSGAILVNETFNFNNTSDDSDYNYPLISFTTSAIGDGITLTNNNDSGRQFIFSSISALETMTVDCNRQTIVSSTGLKRMTNFNKHFFRLLPGNNQIVITGGLTSFVMTSTFARKVGA